MTYFYAFSETGSTASVRSLVGVLWTRLKAISELGGCDSGRSLIPLNNTRAVCRPIHRLPCRRQSWQTKSDSRAPKTIANGTAHRPIYRAVSLWCFSTLARGSAAVVERLRDALSIKNLADHLLVLGFTTDYNDGFYNSHPTTMTFSCCINVWEITNVCKRLRPFCILEISFSNKWRNCPQEENQWVSANPGSLGKQPLNGGGGCWG